MDEPYLLAAARYVELNPVRAGLVPDAVDWPWSSARAHLSGRDDRLVHAAPMPAMVANWRGLLDSAIREEELRDFREHVRSGCPLGNATFVDRQERVVGRILRPQKPGRPSKLPEYNIGMIMKGIKQGVARKAINYLRANSPGFLDRLKVTWPTGRIEYRFWLQGGGYDRNIDNSKTAWHSVNYLHNNPVSRGLVESPMDWEWSSARWYAGHTQVRLAMDGVPPDPPEDA